MNSKLSPILSIKNLKLKSFDDTEILKGVDIDLYSNEIHGLLGVSGSGKSMTALSVLQLLNRDNKFVTDGEIYLNSEDPKELIKLNERALERIRGKRIGLIFQDALNTFNPSIKCFDQILEAALNSKQITKKEGKALVKKLISWVDLKHIGHIENAYPHQLSGGQLQRLMVAMTLAQEPQIIIADEATTALDNITQKEILELIVNIRQEFGTSIILISHDLNVLANMCDRISLMWEGKIVETVNNSDFFNAAKHPVLQALLLINKCFDSSLDQLPISDDLFTIGDKSEVLLKDFSIDQFINKHKKKVFNAHQKALVLEGIGLEKSYTQYAASEPSEANRKILKGVSFKLIEGSVAGIVGASGCGKSTLARLLSGMEEPDKGEVLFNGVKLKSKDKAQFKAFRKDVQIIFQDPRSSLDPLMKIGPSIMEVVRLKYPKEDEQYIKNKTLEMLLMVDLKREHFDRYPAQLSGGQCQRVCIARALVLNPKVLICDEIVSSLDLLAKANILNILLEQVKKNNLALVFITHDLKVLKFLADYVYIMQNGQFIEEGSNDYIFNRAKMPYTQRLINSILKFKS
jgi:peptide/nickel transport system ATP-binding protein